MTEKILILGGSGRMGQIIVQELSEDYIVTSADLKLPTTDTLESNTRFTKADLSDYNVIKDLIQQHDMIVGCLPAEASFMAATAAIECKKDMVDLSYMKENPFLLNNKARVADVTVLVDVGVAPGLTNLIAGKVLAEQGHITSGKLMVGGMAADRNRPYGYRLTWSPSDLLAEYTRVARYLDNGRVAGLPALSGVEEVIVPGVGVLEAFMTDGLRTLLKLEKTQHLVEKTMRWPGHVNQVLPLLENGTFIEEIQEHCSEGDDMVVLYCEIDGRKFHMVAYPKDGLTAMQRTTALTCATFARLVAECGSLPHGLLTPEEVGKDEGLYGFITEELRIRFNIEIKES